MGTGSRARKGLDRCPVPFGYTDFPGRKFRMSVQMIPVCPNGSKVGEVCGVKDGEG